MAETSVLREFPELPLPSRADIEAMRKLVGQHAFKFAPRVELTQAQMRALCSRAAATRTARSISPRAFARLRGHALARFAADAGLSVGEARFAQLLTEVSWALRRFTSMSHHLALTQRARRSH